MAINFKFQKGALCRTLTFQRPSLSTKSAVAVIHFYHITIAGISIGMKQPPEKTVTSNRGKNRKRHSLSLCQLTGN